MERKIEQELRRSGKYADTSRLQQSLFQRWFEMFRFDSPKLRTITLDEQFRMHPELGTFVSSVFYGSPTAVGSHPSTSVLTHELDPYRGKVAAWINVPHDSRETRAGHSVVRHAEASRVVAELASLVGQDTRRQLSFGIISFYKGQVDAIQEELLKAGLLVPDDENAKESKPVPRMAWTDEQRPRPRLRVGTVDAFQGMEFDVVLLSVTRSSLPDRDDDTPEAALRRYGHLTSEQRMCVAMSRQRRLLLAVGDAAMADRDTAPTDPARPGRSLVEGLVAFLELCKGPHGADVRS
jgi:superfamily I DNA and/or RNA helicase